MAGANGRQATLDDIRQLSYTRLVLSEGLRLYPQPPILLRRALKEVCFFLRVFFVGVVYMQEHTRTHTRMYICIDVCEYVSSYV